MERERERKTETDRQKDRDKGREKDRKKAKKKYLSPTAFIPDFKFQRNDQIRTFFLRSLNATDNFRL